MNYRMLKHCAVVCGAFAGLIVVMAFFRITTNQAKNRHSVDYQNGSMGLIEFRCEQARSVLGRELSAGESARYLFYDLSGVTNGYEALVGRDILHGQQLLLSRRAFCAALLFVELIALACIVVLATCLVNNSLSESQANDQATPGPQLSPPNRASPPPRKMPPRRVLPPQERSRRIPPRPGASPH